MDMSVDADGNILLRNCTPMHDPAETPHGGPVLLEMHELIWRRRNTGQMMQMLRDMETEYVRLFGPTDRFDKARQNLLKNTHHRPEVTKTG